jgi:hypothetical protein
VTAEQIIELVKVVGVPGVMLGAVMLWVKAYIANHDQAALMREEAARDREKQLNDRITVLEESYREQLTALVVATNQTLQNWLVTSRSLPCMFQKEAGK